jgi:hypothetical protein
MNLLKNKNLLSMLLIILTAVAAVGGSVRIGSSESFMDGDGDPSDPSDPNRDPNRDPNDDNNEQNDQDQNEEQTEGFEPAPLEDKKEQPSCGSGSVAASEPEGFTGGSFAGF